MIASMPKKQPGFTLIEMILVIAIISFLMAWILPQIFPLIEQSKLTQKRSLIEQVYYDQHAKAISGFTESKTTVVDKKAGYLAYGMRFTQSGQFGNGIYAIKAQLKNTSANDEPDTLTATPSPTTNILSSSAFGEEQIFVSPIAVVENLEVNGSPVEYIDILFPPFTNKIIAKTTTATNPTDISFTIKSTRFPKNIIDVHLEPRTAHFTFDMK